MEVFFTCELGPTLTHKYNAFKTQISYNLAKNPMGAKHLSTSRFFSIIVISTVIETLDRCTFYSVKTFHTISCKFLKINILLSLILGTVQNVNKIFMSDKLVISFINDVIEFLKNKNPESGRSCCKTF
jgi:hypothetical protein